MLQKHAKNILSGGHIDRTRVAGIGGKTDHKERVANGVRAKARTEAVTGEAAKVGTAEVTMGVVGTANPEAPAVTET